MQDIYRLDLGEVAGFTTSLLQLRPDEKAEENATLQLAFGKRLGDVLTLDPRPMLFKAMNLLDPYEGLYHGKLAWYYGKEKYGFIVTQDVWEKAMAPALTGAPHYPGHQMNDYKPALGNLVWAGLENGMPAALIYPTDEDYRKRLLSAAAQGILGKTFPVSLAMRLVVNQKTKEVTGLMQSHLTSLDLVRWTGTESAMIEEAAVLNSNNDGKRITMYEIKVEKLEDLLKDSQVSGILEAEVQKRLASGELKAQILKAASLEDLKGNAEVAKLMLLKPKSEVLASVNEKDIPELTPALTKSAPLRQALSAEITELAKKIEEFREQKAKPILIEKLGEAVGGAQLLSHDWSAMDEQEVRTLCDTVLANLGQEGGDKSKGRVQNAQSDKPNLMQGQRAFLGGQTVDELQKF